MGWDRNDCYITCGEKEDAEKELGEVGNPYDEIKRLRAALHGMYVLFGEPLEDEYTGVQAYKSALDVVEKARIALRK